MRIFISSINLCILFVFIFTLVDGGLYSQPICTGSTGDNIFSDGDFGSGADNIVLNDPGTAPGFTYTIDMPPEDGFYTITNNMANWNDSYRSWIRIPDNSSDPNGYMMVINSNFSPGLIFIQDVDNLCEQTTYAFSADIINVTGTGHTDQILPNVTFLIDGIERFSTGNIEQDEVWHTFGFIFTTDIGQTSVELSLRNNAPGGFGNDLALDNISFNPCGSQVSIDVMPNAILCEDTDQLTLNAQFSDVPGAVSIQWQVSTDLGITWNDISGETQEELLVSNLVNGFYLYRFLFAESLANLSNINCRLSSEQLEVEIIPTYTSINDTICQGLTTAIGTSFYSESGTYIDTLENRLGCDSIVTLDLMVVNNNVDVITTFMDPLCPGDQNGVINLESILNAADPVTISLNDQRVEEMEFPLIVREGEYNLEVTDRFGCSYTEIIALTDPRPFMVTGLSDLVINLGDDIQLNPSASFMIDSVEWINHPDFSCLDCLQPILSPVNTTSYSATFWNKNDCRYDVNFEIVVEKIRATYISNAFTPNNDGTNDGFTIHGIPRLVSDPISLHIFNRWGSLVFSSDHVIMNDESTGWDGQFNDQDLPMGVYIYIFSVPFIDGEILTYQGDLTLLR